MKNRQEIKAALEGQVIKNFHITKDDALIQIQFESGKSLSICGKLIPFIDVTPELKIEVRENV